MRPSTAAVLCTALLALGGIGIARSAAAEGGPAPTGFQPPPDTAIPAGRFGDEVRFGKQIFEDPAGHAGKFVGNDLHCSNCHLDAGRLAGSSPMWAAWVSYPAYRKKTDHVESFAERLQGCFLYSMNGKEPPLGDPVLIALESYSYFLAKGVPTGEPPKGRGFPELPKPAMAPDYARGATVFTAHCAACHGANGAGQKAGGKAVFPALWGAQSFNWGAGMASIKNAAEFIHANMPLGQGGSLTPQEAWDVAAYVDSQIRPQDPRFTDTVAETRKAFHDTPFSMYGKTVEGKLLGDPATTPAAGTVPAAPQTK